MKEAANRGPRWLGRPLSRPMHSGNRANVECAAMGWAALSGAEPGADFLFPHGLQCCGLNRGRAHFCGALHFPHAVCPAWIDHAGTGISFRVESTKVNLSAAGD